MKIIDKIIKHQRQIGILIKFREQAKFIRCRRLGNKLLTLQHWRIGSIKHAHRYIKQIPRY